MPRPMLEKGSSTVPRTTLNISPSSSPSPGGRRNYLTFWERVGVRAIWIFKFIVFAAITRLTIASDLPHDSDYDYDPPAPGSYVLPVVKRAGDGALLDTNNKAVNLRDLTHGRVTVLSFIYTRCAAPKACPYATGVLGQLHDMTAKDETLAKNMRLVSVSFDPEYDTPQHLAAYSENVREEKSGCEWRFVTAKSRAELEPILNAYDQAVDKRSNPADPQGPLYHTLARLFNRSRRSHPEHLQFQHTRPSPCPRRCEDSLVGGSEVFQTITDRYLYKVAGSGPVRIF